MPEHILRDSLTLPLPRPEVFAFFADAANLARITPPELDFAILSPLPIVMCPGALISYRLHLFGVPFNWTSEITAWSPPDFFVDEQRSGPYRQWIHTHTFSDTADGGTLIEDEVHYRLPRLPLGEVALPLVEKQLQRIFAYRRAAVEKLLLFPGGPKKNTE